MIFVVAPAKYVSYAMKKRAIEAISENGTSLYIVDAFAFIGYINEATQSISSTFAIFEPIIFPSARSVCPLTAESILTKNSGAEVPKATTVSHITSGDIPKFFAILEDHSTKKSAHFMRMKNPIISNI